MRTEIGSLTLTRNNVYTYQLVLGTPNSVMVGTLPTLTELC
jgi:hypothetical protein